jgi:hypothetical protein
MTHGPETKLNLFILTGQADEDQLLQAGEGAGPEIMVRCLARGDHSEVVARYLAGGDHGYVLVQKRSRRSAWPEEIRTRC